MPTPGNLNALAAPLSRKPGSCARMHDCRTHPGRCAVTMLHLRLATLHARNCKYLFSAAHVLSPPRADVFSMLTRNKVCRQDDGGFGGFFLPFESRRETCRCRVLIRQAGAAELGTLGWPVTSVTVRLTARLVRSPPSAELRPEMFGFWEGRKDG